MIVISILCPVLSNYWVSAYAPLRSITFRVSKVIYSYDDMCAGAMPIKAKVTFLMSLVLLVVLWKETQGRCFSCPRNDCSQTEMPRG